MPTSNEPKSELTASDSVAKAIVVLKSMFSGMQHSWPETMHLSVPIGKINQALELLGAAMDYEINALGKHTKDV